MIRILVVDDHEVVRRGVVTLLDGVRDWKVCGEAADGREAIARATDLKPDVVVLDVSMPTMGGVEAARIIRHAIPATIIIILSMHDPDRISAAAGADVDACINKTSAGAELKSTIARLLERQNVAD